MQKEVGDYYDLVNRYRGKLTWTNGNYEEDLGNALKEGGRKLMAGNPVYSHSLIYRFQI